MTENIVLDTQITEASMTAGEVEMLLFALERARAQFAWKCGGLDADGLNKPLPPSTMTLGGLLKHLALAEDMRLANFVTGQPLGPPWDARDAEENWAWAWRTADDDTALVDMIEEYIRHTGHADLLREAVDGLVGEDPPQ